MKLTGIHALGYVGMDASLPLVDGVTTLTGPNAGGKTKLANIVPGVLFNEVKLLSGANIGFTWEGDAGPGSMFVSKKGNKTTWRGTVNGESAEHSLIRPAQKWLQEHFPVPDAVFTNANFLAAFRSSTMLAGTPAARMQMLADIVNLHVFDDLKVGISKLVQDANVTIALRKRIMEDLAQLADLGADVAPKFNLHGITDYLAERRSDIKSEAMELARALEDRPYGNIPLDKLEEALRVAPERNKAWDAWEECESLNIYDIKKASKADYETALVAAEVVGRGLESLVNGKTTHVYNKTKQDRILARHLANIDTIRKQLEHLDGHDGNKCPTCGGAINNKKLVRSLQAALKELKGKTEALRANVILAANSDWLQGTLNDANITTKDLRYMMACDYEELIESYEKAIEIEQRFGGELPSKPTKPRIDVGEITAEIKLRKKGYGMLDEGERQYERLTKKFRGANGVLLGVTQWIEENTESEVNHRRLQKLKAELSNLPNTEDAELLLELLKALDNRNARNRYLEMVAENLVIALNELAPAYFQYKMEFAWSNGKLLANRKGATTDTALLSGREGRAFLLLNAVAIQQCLPPANRLRSLILDELEAGSSPENRALLSELIPGLLEHYDNILVVTPLAKHEFYIEGARFRVTEKKGKQSLVREE